MKNLRPQFTHALAAAAFLCVAAIASAMPVHAAGNDVTVEASNWKFSPATIVAHVGVPTTIHIKSVEGVHGISSDELGIANTILPPNKDVTVTFTPKKAGTYVVHCSVPCGSGHADMKFTVKVEA